MRISRSKPSDRLLMPRNATDATVAAKPTHNDASARRQTVPHKLERAITSLSTHVVSTHRSVVALPFDEEAYLQVYPDIALAMQLGEYTTAREHLLEHGLREGRLQSAGYLKALGVLPQAASTTPITRSSIDIVVISATGMALIVGWIDDRASALQSLAVFAGMEQGWRTTAIVRTRREDVDADLGAPSGHSFGFWTIMQLDPVPARDRPWTIMLQQQDGRYCEADFQPRMLTDHEARDLILGYIASAAYCGNRDVETFAALENGCGAELVAFNRRISRAIVAGVHLTHHGPSRRHFRGSIIVCLFGRHEFMFLQSALFASAAGSSEHEYIFVSNSPELTETLEREAQIGALIYGLSIAVITLPGNAGFSAANNIAAQFARSDRIMFVNPDVFPRTDDWAMRHAAIVEQAPREQTSLFGALLYYGDGSLMHGGMYFESDQGMSIHQQSITSRSMLRVEHYGKGAPSWSDKYTHPRPVPAITGAFVSADRAWFEALGGFNEDYLFGHYEDADLCLRSLREGRPAWLHNLQLWHMEGQGSTRRPPHEGGSLVNRWWFSRTWSETIDAGLLGPNPAHPLLRPPPIAEPVKSVRQRHQRSRA